MNSSTISIHLSDNDYVNVVGLCREAFGAKPGYLVCLPTGVRFRSEHISSIEVEYSTLINEETHRPKSARVIIKLDHYRKAEQ